MAEQFKISDGTTTVDLTGTTGFVWLWTYIPAVALEGYVEEVIPVKLEATSDDNRASTLQDLWALNLLAEQYFSDPSQHAEVWLTRQLPGETNARRSLVRSCIFVPDPPVAALGLAAPAASKARTGKLVVTRHFAWEDADASNEDFVSATPSAAVAIEYDPLDEATVPGDIHARIEGFNLCSDTANTDPIDRVWIGIRGEDKYGVTATNFVYIWELEDGTNEGSGDTTDYAPE